MIPEGFAGDLQLLLQLEAARVVLDGRQVDYEATVAFKKAFARKVWKAVPYVEQFIYHLNMTEVSGRAHPGFQEGVGSQGE
jgi:hypothetical protein